MIELVHIRVFVYCLCWCHIYACFNVSCLCTLCMLGILTFLLIECFVLSRKQVWWRKQKIDAFSPSLALDLICTLSLLAFDLISTPCILAHYVSIAKHGRNLCFDQHVTCGPKDGLTDGHTFLYIYLDAETGLKM